MEPTNDKLAAIMRDSTLMSGFDDPEVMAAVQEIAMHPGAMQNYTHNAKVSLQLTSKRTGLEEQHLTWLPLLSLSL